MGVDQGMPCDGFAVGTLESVDPGMNHAGGCTFSALESADQSQSPALGSFTVGIRRMISASVFDRTRMLNP